MIKVAITGNIASGKSKVQEILNEKGFKVLDADDVSHELLTVKNKELFDEFKDYDVFEDGEFSRLKFGQLIFSNFDERKKLEKIMHPQIENEIKKFFDNNLDEKILFVGIPLLFEANMQNLFDKIILVYTDDEIRLKRLIKRNDYTQNQALARINSQMNQDEKVSLSDYVINNNGTFEQLKKKVFALIDQL